MASVVGNDFTLDALQEVTCFEESNLRKILDQLLKSGLLKHRIVRGEDVCSFADIIMRDVVYEEVGTFERKKLHGNVGTALEKAYAGKVEEHLGELGYHFLENGDKEKALDYFLRAGDKAAKICANAEATSYYQSALKLLEQKGDEPSEKGRVLEQLGSIKDLVGEYDACMKYWSEALLLFKQLNEKETVARLHRKTANVLWNTQGHTEKAKGHHEEALKILEKEPESAELASLFDDMARLYRRTEDVPKARFWAEKAVELAEKFSDYEVIANSYMTLGSAIAQTGTHADLEKAVEYGETALKIALDNGLTDATLRAYSYLADYLTEEGIKLLEKGYELAKKVGDVRWISEFGTDLADAYGFIGDMDRAVSLMEESVALDRKAGNITHLSYSLVELGWCYGLGGEWDKCEQHFKEALSLAQKANDNGFVAWSFNWIGWLYGFGKGDWVKAKEQFEKALEICEKTGAESSARAYKLNLIWTCIELGETEKAEKLLDKMPKIASKARSEYFWLAIVDSRWGRLFRAQKKWKESIEFFDKSLQELEAFTPSGGNIYYFAREVLYEYARMYLERDQPGDKEKAHNLLNQALGIFQKIGAKKDIEKTMKLMEEVLHPPKTQAHEKTVSPASYVCDEVRGNITVSPRELKVGENLELEIELTNTRKEGVILLTKITEVVPEGFAVAKKPEFYRMEGNCLNMKEKRLGPQETEEVKLVLTPKIQGTLHVNPKILFIDANGKEKTLEPKPTSITVKELGIKGWLKGER